MRKLLYSIFCIINLLLSLCFLDRYLYKKNLGFCIGHIYSTLPYTSSWTLADNSLLSEQEVSSLFNQPFRYLGKGHQTVAFVSEDNCYVLKFYRFPSHMRLQPWTPHLLAYQYQEKRKEIKKYNEQKLQDSLSSYRIAFSQAPEESALLMIHLQKTKDPLPTVTLIDTAGHRHFVPLQETVFLVQRKGDLIFPSLKRWIEEKKTKQAQHLIKSLFDLIARRMENRIEDKDAVLSKNYGCLGCQAFQLDVGRLHSLEKKPSRQEIRQEQIRICKPLEEWLKQEDENLFLFYQNLIIADDN